MWLKSGSSLEICTLPSDITGQQSTAELLRQEIGGKVEGGFVFRQGRVLRSNSGESGCGEVHLWHGHERGEVAERCYGAIELR
jgi:hypothetical protein